MSIHHCIPLVLWGDNTPENKTPLEDNIHTRLHGTQDLSGKQVRKYRMKVNGILIPNDYVFDMKQALWQEFFDWASIAIKSQEQSLIRQINRNKAILWDSTPALDWNLNELVAQLIGTEKDLVFRQLRV